MSGLSLIHLPDIALEHILSFLSYDEIAKNRVVCRKFNNIGSNLLTRGFVQIEKRSELITKNLLSKLPRRESERRGHELSRHFETMQAFETRMSMLNMNYKKFIDSNIVCFIPGKVLDEMKNVLNTVEMFKPSLKCSMLMQEFRDLSTMAIEHFTKEILPIVMPELQRKTVSDIRWSVSSQKTTSIPRRTQHVLRNEIESVKTEIQGQWQCILEISQDIATLVDHSKRQDDILRKQWRKIRKNNKTIEEQNARIRAQQATLTEIKKHLRLWDEKCKILLVELIQAKDNYLAATAGPSNQVPRTSTKVHKSSMKPRMKRILSKCYMNLPQQDLDRKREFGFLPEIPFKRYRFPDENRISFDLNEMKMPEPLIRSRKHKLAGETVKRSKRKCTVHTSKTISESLKNIFEEPQTSKKNRKRKLSEALV